jgi:hypothetical protein
MLLNIIGLASTILLQKSTIGVGEDILCYDAAIKHTPSRTEATLYRHNIGVAQRLTSEKLGLSAQWSTKAHQSAVKNTPKSNPEYHILLHGLALSLHANFNFTGRKCDLLEAISVAENALKLTDHQANTDIVEEGRRLLQQTATYDTYDELIEKSIELYRRSRCDKSLEHLTASDYGESIYMDEAMDDCSDDDGRSIIDDSSVSRWWRRQRS